MCTSHLSPVLLRVCTQHTPVARVRSVRFSSAGGGDLYTFWLGGTHPQGPTWNFSCPSKPSSTTALPSPLPSTRSGPCTTRRGTTRSPTSTGTSWCGRGRAPAKVLYLRPLPVYTAPDRRHPRSEHSGRRPRVSGTSRTRRG